jgi:hypothetical protein
MFKKGYASLLISSLLISSIMINLSGCVVTYGQFPKDRVGASWPEKRYKHMFYHVEGVSMAAGYHAIKEAFQTSSPFMTVEPFRQVPEKGIYTHVDVKNLPPSIPSLVFGYISIIFLTLTPAWTTKGGTDLFYEVYHDGKMVKAYEYSIRRKGVLWIVTLPFIWVNLFTYSEVDAFEATANQFFKDAQPIFESIAEAAH